jgi:branched-chain amino acid transport system substrate-binding protein
MDRREFLAAGIAAGALPAFAQQKGTIKIVSSMPRTGAAKGPTDSIVNAIQLAIDEEKGAAAGFKIEYRDLDDATAAAGLWTVEAETANARDAVKDADVMAMIGPYNSGAAKVSMPILNAAGLLQITPAATWPGLTMKVDGGGEGEPGIYRPAKRITFCRTVPHDAIQGPLSAEFARDELKVKSVYVVDDSVHYGQGVAAGFKKRCEELKIKVLAHESIDPVATRYDALMNRVKAANPDLLYFGGTSQTNGGQIAKDVFKVGLKCPLMVPDGCYEPLFIELAGAETLNGRCYATNAWVDPSQLPARGKEFVKRYKAKYQRDPEAYAVYGYEAAKVVLEAIKTAGKKDRAAILKAALATKDFDKGALEKWSFDANGDTTLKQLTVSKIEGGKFKPVKLVTKTG